MLVVCLLFGFYRPDRPLDNIEPGSSSQPTFIVQIIRPRIGLPLGGLLPPGIFGVDTHLGFDSTSDHAIVNCVVEGRIELQADDWNLRLVYDSDGRIQPQTQVIFDLIFEDRRRRVRCRPADPAIGTLNIELLQDSGDLAGNFDIELTHCEDAQTGASLGWPSTPLILHGSFDRLPIDSDKK